MKPPKVTRGRITNLRTGIFLAFLYNPSSISERKGANLIVDTIPGQSDPLIRWMSGKDSTIQFTLQLCGESSLRRRGVQIFNGAVTEFPIADAVDSYSIAGEIEFLESFQFPVNPETIGTFGGADGAAFRGGQHAGADLAVLTFGRRYQGVICSVESVDVNIHEFDPELSPTRADIAISMKRYNTKNRFSTDIWIPPVELEGIL